ncbi:rho GDP-dissociation inhibitor 1-like isoform X1 [Denticeps clupeoides]|uniref:Rho GDP dissociation inhibitor n=1 Tax=Denticeps clupeoides TaxID=299321 RepID=A0AAY4D8F0_9TELE|nr:rho GDP-dissociation inhibitor 1-like isoform X1 [Denticeps clupeoides]
MSEQDPTVEQLAAIAAENEQTETETVNYKPPAVKTIQEIHDLDKNDESLQKYKKSLLGGDSGNVANPSVPNVEVTTLTLVCDTAPSPITIDLQGYFETLRDQSYILKEGVEYRIKITFKVNNEIVSGLKLIQETYRKGVKIDKSIYMLGSYGPRPEEYEFLTTVEEAPKGLLACGTYHIKSSFTDDDKHDHLSWEWVLSIKKDWTD